jgi:bifunctional UDP-N-acetylglucosamine pyrophosphorylase / glucosamine-1-phosphate N-acetyltransferase
VGYGEAAVKEELLSLSKLGIGDDVQIVTILQKEQKGTGHAIQTAMPELSSNTKTVLIVPGDTPLITSSVLISLMEEQQSSQSIITFLTSSPAVHYGGGRVVRSIEGDVQAIVEEKDCTLEQLEIREINSSIYAVDATFLQSSIKQLKADNAQGEFYLTDIVELAVGSGKKAIAMKVKDEFTVAGANTRNELLQLEEVRRSEINNYHMENGVSFESPQATFIDEEVEIGEDSYIGSGTRLLGTTRIGKSVRIDGNSIIANSIIQNNSHIKLSCVIDSSTIGKQCVVGPFAHLRPGTELGQSAKIGNFVETKKAVFAENAKASHLTYVGDALVEANVNIGAGTITCNYDGKRKHQTIIREGAFIGSNSSLVAPVQIGKRAVVGAGSVITKNVPDDALAIERTELKIITNRGKKKLSNEKE